MQSRRKSKDFQDEYRHGMLQIIPSTDVAQIVNKQRNTHHPDARDGAHITITRPFKKKPTQLELEKIQTILKDFAPFTVWVGRLNRFAGSATIKYDCGPVEALRDLNAALTKTGFFREWPDYITEFNPHMTVTESEISPEDAQRLCRKINENEVLASDMSFVCTELIYVTPNEEFYFKPYVKFTLGK